MGEKNPVTFSPKTKLLKKEGNEDLVLQGGEKIIRKVLFWK